MCCKEMKLLLWARKCLKLGGIYFCQRSFDKGFQVGIGYATENNLC